MTTIKKIAELAKVSPSTVSKALNDRPDIGMATKKRIAELAQELNYRPNIFARGLKMRTTENIGIIICKQPQPLSSNPFYSRVFEGIEAEVAIQDRNLLAVTVSENISTSQRLPKMIEERHVDGVILIGRIKQSYVKKIASLQLPIVVVDNLVNLPRISHILIDNLSGAFEAVTHLAELGHQNIAFLSGPLNRTSFRERYKGYVKALKSLGLPFQNQLVRIGGIEAGYELMKSLLETSKIPTAVFAANDINAIYAMKAISEKGLRVPQDISIVGFDDIEWSKHTIPSLTTVRVYKEEMGSLAVRLLMEGISEKSANPITKVVPVKLVVRDSTAKPKI